MKEKTLVQMILPLLIIVFFLLFLINLYYIFQHQKRELLNEISGKLNSSDKIFKEDIQKGANFLFGLIDFVQKNKELEKAIKNNDVDTLKRAGDTIFKQLKSKHNITHFTFISTDRISLVRLHEPSLFGDKINRYTMLQAEKTGKPSYGLELGLLGTYTIRAVVPWYIDQKLIGYIELGDDIDDIIDRIRDTLNIEPFVLIEKKLLNQKNWEAGIKILGYNSSWGILPNYVINNKYKGVIPQSLIRIFSDNSFKKQQIYLFEPSNDIRYNLGYFPISDAKGKEVGVMVLVDNYEDIYHQEINTFAITALLSLSIILILIAFFFKILSSIDHRLTNHNIILENTVKERTADLLQANSVIESRYLLQDTLRKILAIAVEDISMDDLLDLILAELIKLPFLSIEGKGLILLIEDNPEILILKMHNGLSEEIIKKCASVNLGYCLCGRAAKERKVIFASCIDSDHDIMYDGIKPHGHFVIPIISGENLLGILNFYMCEGVERNQQEEDFLISVTNTLASIIERKKTADLFKINSEENLKIQQMLNVVLKISMQSITLQKQIEIILYIILSSEWLGVNSNALVHLVDEKSLDRLVLIAQVGIPADIAVKCSNIPFSHCICGEVAKNKKSIYTQSSTTAGCCKGHFCNRYITPILSGDKLLGILNIYAGDEFNDCDETDAMHVLWHKMEHFISSLTSILAGIIEKKKIEQTLEQMANYDTLTNLPNRAFFINSLSNILWQAKRYIEMFAILFIDLDGFKAVNDTFGHNIGDLLLKEVANRLTGCLRRNDVLSRIGGDEFIILLNRIKSRSEVSEVAERIITQISAPFHLDNNTCNIGTSIGISIHPDDGENVDELIKKADNSMYDVKKQGKNNFKFFS